MGRKKKNDRKKKRARGQPPGVGDEDSPPTDLLARMIAHQIENLRLVRAIDAADIHPRDIPGLTDSLTRLTEYDALLMSAIEVFDREGRRDSEGPDDPLLSFIALADSVRDRILAALPPDALDRLLAVRPGVAASEAEVWLMVDGIRKAASKEGPIAEPTPFEIRRQHEETRRVLEEGLLPEGEQDERVQRQEQKTLPRTETADAWFERLPVGWLRTIAHLLDVDPKPTKVQLVWEISEALRDSDRLVPILRDRLGRPEREHLAFFLLLGEAPLDDLPGNAETDLAVGWDWSMGLPGGTGAKLRAFGFVFVGLRRGVPTVAIPPEIVHTLATALRPADPVGFDALPEEFREDLQDLADGYPVSQDPGEDGRTAEIELLMQFEETALEGLTAWSEEHTPPSAASDVFFGPLPEEDRDEDVLTGCADFALLDFPTEPDGHTLIQRYLTAGPALNEAEAEILKQLTKSRPSLYRVKRVMRPWGAELVDVFRGGPSIIATDRFLAEAVERDTVVAGRVYPIGRFVFVRPLAYLIEPEDTEAAQAWLEDAFRQWAASTRNLDRNAFLTAHSEKVAHASFLQLLETSGGVDEKPYRETPAVRPRRKQGNAKIYEIDVKLREAHIPIWRRIRVPGDFALSELHDVIQTAMGWENDHIHKFAALDGRWEYSDPQFGLECDDEGAVTLADIAPRRGSRFLYNYDFGDDWWHEIRVEARLDPAEAGPAPSCVAGAGACPPEDVGGTSGYERMLAILADPDHEEYEEMRDWAGDDIDPERFDIEGVNRHLEEMM